MPDTPDTRPDGPGHAWDAAFAGLPAEAPPPGGWERIAAALDARGASPRTAAAARPPMARRPAWLALAATLLLAVALPWRSPPPDTASPSVPVATAGPGISLDTLYAESARLETLLAHASDDRVASGSAATMAAGLEGRLAAIDAALAQPGLSEERQVVLWRERVAALEALVSFEGTRRWLAANGEQYDGALVQVN